MWPVVFFRFRLLFLSPSRWSHTASNIFWRGQSITVSVLSAVFLLKYDFTAFTVCLGSYHAEKWSYSQLGTFQEEWIVELIPVRTLSIHDPIKSARYCPITPQAQMLPQTRTDPPPCSRRLFHKVPFMSHLTIISLSCLHDVLQCFMHICYNVDSSSLTAHYWHILTATKGHRQI